MLPKSYFLSGLLLASTMAPGQQGSQPQVKVNVLNVCTPSPADQQEIGSALNSVPRKADFGADFEVDRGRSTLDEAPGFLQAGGGAQMAADSGTAAWVRIRHDFAGHALFSSVQYSFSQDPRNMVETLVFRVRDPKDLLGISIEDNATVTTPAVMLAVSTPASRVKLERFGKSSVVLARCEGSEGGPPTDQSAYEPLFRRASEIMTTYRALLDVRRTVPADLARVGTAAPKSKSPGTASKKKTIPPGSKPE